jgi:hypothetical protein
VRQATACCDGLQPKRRLGPEAIGEHPALSAHNPLVLVRQTLEIALPSRERAGKLARPRAADSGKRHAVKPFWSWDRSNGRGCSGGKRRGARTPYRSWRAARAALAKRKRLARKGALPTTRSLPGYVRSLPFRWQGTAGRLDRVLDPHGHFARRWGKHWPTGKGITARLKRHRKALERQGWILCAEHIGNKGQVCARPAQGAPAPRHLGSPSSVLARTHDHSGGGELRGLDRPQAAARPLVGVRKRRTGCKDSSESSARSGPAGSPRSHAKIFAVRQIQGYRKLGGIGIFTSGSDGTPASVRTISGRFLFCRRLNLLCTGGERTLACVLARALCPGSRCRTGPSLPSFPWQAAVLPARICLIPILITIVGPIAAGKNTVAELVADRCTEAGRAVVVADVDDVAFMLRPGARRAELWLAAHRAHGALVGQWMQSTVDVVVALGPIYDQDEQQALYGQLPIGGPMCRVLIDAPLATTWRRVSADSSRGGSRQREFHERAHARYRSLVAGVPVDLKFDSSRTSAAEIADAICRAAGVTLV